MPGTNFVMLPTRADPSFRKEHLFTFYKTLIMQSLRHLDKFWIMLNKVNKLKVPVLQKYICLRCELVYNYIIEIALLVSD